MRAALFLALTACGRIAFDPTTDGGNPVEMAGPPIAIGVSSGTVCALHESGKVSCWGNNGDGQLADGTNVTRSTPALVPGIDDAIDISLGNTHYCILHASRRVSCWGTNNYGQLGRGTQSVIETTVDYVTGLDDAVEVSAGYQHTCARRANGTLACWGRGDTGELGHGAAENSPLPRDVMAIDDAVGVSAGGFVSCAARAGGQAWCWGYGEEGQLGNGTTTITQLMPTPVSNLTDVAEVHAGFWSVCARERSGAAYCWGGNFNGELGVGDSSLRKLVPTPVVGMSDATDLVVGSSTVHSCARHSDGRWSCWGPNGYGQRGDGDAATTVSPTATAITDEELAAGGAVTCGRNGSRIRCWGGVGVGQAGDGVPMYHARPVVISALPATGDFGSGNGHMCSVAAGVVRCSGYNADHQLGDGTILPRMTQVPVLGVPATATFVSASSTHSCARLGDGTARCWGDNSWGALGDDTMGVAKDAVTVTGLSGLTNIHTGDGYTCAYDGANLTCWGSNFYGQLGDGTVTSRTTKAVAVTDATWVAVRGSTNCVVRTNNSVACWGRGTEGQIGDGAMANRPTPTTVGSFTDAVSVAVGDFHACVSLMSGEVWCWGRNTRGQLGNGSKVDSPVPVRVVGLSDALSVKAGDGFTCARRTGGAITCWGDNRWGQLGDGTLTDSAVPVPVPDLTSTFLYVGYDYSCAQTTAETWCWGWQGSGQFGDGTQAIRLVPTTSAIGFQ